MRVRVRSYWGKGAAVAGVAATGQWLSVLLLLCLWISESERDEREKVRLEN